MTEKKGLFLSLEGVDGAGKSTHIPFMADYIQQAGIPVVITREPGGTELGEGLRELLLHQPMHLKTETLLMFAARNEHIETVIQPALNAGKWVLCDRFSDASYAYQGGGRQLGATAIEILEHWVHPDLQPDRTWLFDLPLAVAAQRLQSGRVLDRFEKEQEAFFYRTQRFYHQRAQAQPERFICIDSSQSVQQIQTQLQHQLEALILSWKNV
ncbi:MULTISPECIES: dTMP kinase [Paenalcaligenes]|uniref:Thymidylate kinase n=1 Tax=Paenalcaligenes hermetiae TaxID=1157987 RepID=A0ABP9MBJ7_9BURK|nr:dTMP kinase [Paenalcaligenes sp.]